MFSHDEGIRGETTAESLRKLPPGVRQKARSLLDRSARSPTVPRSCCDEQEKAEELGLAAGRDCCPRKRRGTRHPSLHAQPALAIEQALKKAGSARPTSTSVELNEAFAAVGLVSAKQLGLSRMTRSTSTVARLRSATRWDVRRPHRAEPRSRVEASRRGIGAAALCGGGGQGSAFDLARSCLSGKDSTLRWPEPPMLRRWVPGSRRSTTGSCPTDFAG